MFNTYLIILVDYVNRNLFAYDVSKYCVSARLGSLCYHCFISHLILTSLMNYKSVHRQTDINNAYPRNYMKHSHMLHLTANRFMMTVRETMFSDYETIEEDHQASLAQHVTGEPAASAASSEHTFTNPTPPNTHTYTLTHTLSLILSDGNCLIMCQWH